RRIVLHPPQNRGVCQADATLAHHHDQIAIAQLETQIPTHAQHDDLPVKVPTAEELLNWYERWHLLMIANLADNGNRGGSIVETGHPKWDILILLSVPYRSSRDREH